MTPLNKELKKDITNRLTTSIQKVLESPELRNLSEEQIEQIAKAHYIDTLKDEFSREVKKAKLNDDKLHKYINSWLSGFESKHTIRSFQSNLTYFLEWLNGTSIIDVDVQVVKKYVAYLKSDKKIKNNTRRQRIAACSSFFTDLESSGTLVKNPFLKIKKLPKKRVSVKSAEQIPTNDELDFIENYAKTQIQNAGKVGGRGAKNKENGNILALCALKILRKYGLRVGALKSIKIDSRGYFKATSKGNEVNGRFDVETLELLDSYGLGRKEPFRDYSEAAFSMWLWRTQSADELSGLFKNKFSPHSVRHRFSIDFYKRTKDVHELSMRLGHSSLLVTSAYLAGLRNETNEKKEVL